MDGTTLLLFVITFGLQLFVIWKILEIVKILKPERGEQQQNKPAQPKDKCEYVFD